MSDVSISYKGAEIASLDASGTKRLLTSGKYCEDDIEVAYTKPGGGGNEFRLIDTFELEEAVRELSIDISGYEYTEFYIDIDASGTGADYLYISAMPTGVNYLLYLNGNTYSQKVGISFITPFSVGAYAMNAYTAVGVCFSSNNTVNGYQRSENKSVIRFIAYRSAGKINAGSKFTVYGR